MEKLMELKGTNGTITAYEDRAILARKGFAAFASQGGFTGDRTYFYKDLNSIEFKKPSMMANGYIKFIIAGTIDTKATTGLLGSSMKSLEDPNTVILRAFKKDTPRLSEELYHLLLEKMSAIKNGQDNTTTTVVNTSSNLDELKKLAELRDAGIVTEKEFEEQKAKLLNQ